MQQREQHYRLRPGNNQEWRQSLKARDNLRLVRKNQRDLCHPLEHSCELWAVDGISQGGAVMSVRRYSRVNRCRWCRVLNDPDDKFCAECGEDLSTGPDYRPSPSYWKPLAAFAVIAVVAVMYISGSLDRHLASVGLNLHPCARILFTGNMLCGDELKQWCTATAPLRQLGTQQQQSSDACAAVR